MEIQQQSQLKWLMKQYGMKWWWQYKTRIQRYIWYHYDNW